MSSAPAVFFKVDYSKLDGRQKEVHNFQHIAMLLVKHGYATYPIRDDWNGGDMIARHMTDHAKEMLTIQIKSRMTFDLRYSKKNIWIGFHVRGATSHTDHHAYVFPHDVILKEYEAVRQENGQSPLMSTDSWKNGGRYSWDAPTQELISLLRPYRLDP